VSTVRNTTVDRIPPSYRFRAYQGDPFDFEIALNVEGQPADVDGWTWASLIDIGDDVVQWECTPKPNGVALYLRSADTARLPSRYCRFDVVGRNPLAGEGRTVLRGEIFAAVRVTPPLATVLT
jgi:hypothetical protein